ncbi:hypothetical protein C3K47_10275 [Solitalea longa]|uniref:tRNA (Guanine-N1)-methyltransferase n=1 Tax=Solitalea longa TaxID=2079460 RepID=A0A2S5A2D1_9SPHI|nr:hypothetical protein [Solitalea longa]POY36736.1 hypothetical protein C3K47_10275 [Solitalea longa]
MSKVVIRIAATCLCCISINVNAAGLQNGPSLQSQFDAIIEKANNYQDYKVVKTASLRYLWKNANDSLVKERQKNATSLTKIAKNKIEIDSLKQGLNQQEASLQASTSINNSIGFLGINFSKTGYNTFMWSLIVGLAAVLAYLSFLNGNFKREAQYRIKLFDDLTEEFKTHRMKSNEKEKRLARELQTERNKLEDILAGS